MSNTTTKSALVAYLRRNLWDGVTIRDDATIDAALVNGIELAAGVREWSFMEDKVRVVTTGPYDNGTVLLPYGTASASGTSTDWQANNVPAGTFMRVNGERITYEVLQVVNDTSITLLNAYYGSGSGSMTYQIEYPAIDLPTRFRQAIKVIDLSTRAELAEASFSDLEELRSSSTASGQPMTYAVRPKRNSSTKQIWFYPVPADVYQFDIVFWKQPGWFDTTSTTFKAAPTLDTDIADWPSEYVGVLQRACLVALGDELKNASFTDAAERSFYRFVASHAPKDEERTQPIRVGMGRVYLRNPMNRPRIST